MATTEARKTRYHHGDLRAAMIEAGRALAEEQGEAGVTIAEAARRAGVTATAPYRHFRDRGAFCDAIAASIFEEFEQVLIAARDSAPPGSAESIIALGQAYVRFHVARRNHYTLLWGDLDKRGEDSECAKVGPRCFAVVIGAIEAYRQTHDLGHVPSEEIGLPLWGLVHGFATLAETHAFTMKAPGADVNRLIAQTTRAFLDGFEARAAASRA